MRSDLKREKRREKRMGCARTDLWTTAHVKECIRREKKAEREKREDGEEDGMPEK